MRKVQNIICQFLFFGFIIFAKTGFAQSKRVDAETFAKLMKETTTYQLVDVRTPDEYGGGHLPKAQNLNVKDSDFENKLNKLDKSQPVFVYCLSGGRSRTAADILVKNGFTNVVDMEGGYLKWSTEKRPVEGAKKETGTNGRMTKEEYKAMIKDNQLVLVDYYATWCGPCKKMAPMIEKLEKNYAGKVKIQKIDTDKNKMLAIQNLVNELPTFVFYKNGKEFWRGAGEQDEEWLTELFDLNIGK